MEKLTLEEKFEVQKERWEKRWEEMGLGEVWKRMDRINPFPGVTPMYPEILMTMSILRNYYKETGINPEIWQRMKYENLAEWVYRVSQAIETCERITREPHPPEDSYWIKNLCYLSHPPAYLCRSEMGKASCQALYGKYATVEYVHADDFSREIYWIVGFHNEDGFPVHLWTVGISEDMARYFDSEDESVFTRSTETQTGAPKAELNERLDRRHLRTGVRVRDIPKKYWDPYDWGMAVRDVIRDLRVEAFPKWIHATLYAACVSASSSTIAQNALTSSEFFLYVYYGLNTKAMGLEYNAFGYAPIPPLLNTLLGLPQETFVRHMSELFLGGYDAFHKYACKEEKIPHLFKLKKFIFERGQFFPAYKGIPPPHVLARTIPPSLEPTNVKQYLETPPSKEFWELLESEADVNKETGEIPSMEETGRFQWLFDPSLEPLRAKDFPPMDWNEGQIWPFDITREKVQIMVEEGYDGSGRNIEYYNELADKKLGKK